MFFFPIMKFTSSSSTIFQRINCINSEYSHFIYKEKVQLPFRKHSNKDAKKKNNRRIFIPTQINEKKNDVQYPFSLINDFLYYFTKIVICSFFRRTVYIWFKLYINIFVFYVFFIKKCI